MDEIRACLQSVQADDEECEDDHIEAGGELAFAVFPESAAFIVLGKRAFDHPAFGDDLECVKCVVFGDFDRGAEDVIHSGGKRCSCIPPIYQHMLHVRKCFLVDRESFEGPDD